MWKARGGKFGHGQMLVSGGLLVVLSEPGEIALVRATPEKFDLVGKIKALPGPKTWNPPALFRGLLLVRNHREMALYDLRADRTEIEN